LLNIGRADEIGGSNAPFSTASRAFPYAKKPGPLGPGFVS
jgi:hypothetical protein